MSKPYGCSAIFFPLLFVFRFCRDYGWDSVFAAFLSALLLCIQIAASFIFRRSRVSKFLKDDAVCKKRKLSCLACFFFYFNILWFRLSWGSIIRSGGRSSGHAPRSPGDPGQSNELKFGTYSGEKWRTSFLERVFLKLGTSGGPIMAHKVPEWAKMGLFLALKELIRNRHDASSQLVGACVPHSNSFEWSAWLGL